MEDVDLYGRITLNSIFRLIQIIHMTPGKQSGKKEPLKSLMDYILCSKFGSKKVMNHSNVPIHSVVTVLYLVP